MTSFTKSITKATGILLLLCFNVILHTDASAAESTLHKYAKRRMEDFKLRLHNTLEENRIRRTRSTFEQDGTEEYNTSASQLESSTDIPSVTAWCLVSVNSTDVVFAATYDGNISIFYEFEFISLHQFSSNEPIISFMGFQLGNRLWLVALHFVQKNEQFLQVYEYDYNRTIHSRQHINLNGNTLISTVTIERTPYLVLVKNKDLKEDSNLVLYVWTGTQFDEILMLSLRSKCKYLVAWQMDKVLFFAASLYDKNQLTIWRFAKYKGKFIPVQVLDGSFQIVKHFEYAGSDYLVCGMEDKFVIFWWSGVTFLKQQEFYSMDSDYIVDISILMLPQEGAVIVSVKQNELEYFIQSSSTYYTRIGNITLDSPALKSSTLWKDEDGKFYLLPVFQDPLPTEIIELDITASVAPPFLEILNPENCSEDFFETVWKRHSQIMELHSVASKVWRKDKLAYVPAISVQRFVFSNMTANVANIFFNESQMVPNVSLSSLYDELNKNIQNLEFQIQNVVWKTEDQDITGDVNFKQGLLAEEVNIKELFDHTKINEFETLAFPSLLKVHGSQIFPDDISLENASATLASSKTLNDVQAKDYLLLEKQETISGNLIFQDLTVNHMIIKNKTINGLELSKIVTSTSEQNIENKMFPSLSCKSLSSDYVAGVEASDFQKLVLNNVPELDMPLNFTSDITIENLSLQSFNDLPLMDLFLNSVKTSGNESIRGPKYFLESLNIADLSVLGTVNEINLDDLMTLHTSQNVLNNIAFGNVSFDDLETHSLNEIDLCTEAILRTRDFVVDEIVHFMEPLTVTSISMSDEVHINSIDFSKCVPQYFSQTQYFNDTTVLDSISVLNDIQVDDEDVSSLINKLATNVWLKKQTQFIPEGNFKLLFVKDLIVQTVNGISLDNLALSDGDVTFYTSKAFGDVSVQSLIIQDGKALNNVSITPSMISALEELLSDLHVENIIIKGDVMTNSINDIALSDLMHVQIMQICTGMYTFERILLDYLKANQLNFHAISNIVFSNYMHGSLNLFPDSKILNKNFMYLNGKEMVIQGFLNGKKFEEMCKSVATLNTSQTISNVNFYNLKMKELFVVNFMIPDFSKVISIFTSEYNVSSKHFYGKVTVEDMRLNNSLGKVDLETLQKYAFYKGRDNSVLQHVRFLADLNANTIHVPSYATVDAIDLDDLVTVYSNHYLQYMLFSSIYVKNIEIYGEINGCDLRNAVTLDLKQSRQVIITAPKYVTRLTVDGNLVIESMINQIPEDKLHKYFSNSDFDVSYKTNLHFTNIEATYLKIINVNDVGVDYLMRDAVKHQQLQIIKGMKNFEKLVSSNIVVKALQVKILCGLNIPLIYNKYISKQGKQKIIINRLDQMNARNVTIKGILNGVKLPDDVVLANTDEYISLWNINSSIDVNSDLQSGRIDGVELTHLVKNRVTLSNSETITSQLTFFEDIYLQDFTIKGLVNEISLSNTVRSTTENAIKGLKTFQESLDVFNLNPRSSINGISDLFRLLLNMYFKNASTNVINEVTFSGIKASSLFAEKINNVSLEDLWNKINSTEENFYKKMLNFSSINLETNLMLFIIEKKIENNLPFYGFFELHQVLPYATMKFLPRYESRISGDNYELPTEKMMVWYTSKQSSCNRKMSLEMNVSMDGTLTIVGRVSGRVFPFPLKINNEDIEIFNLYTDKKQSCTPPPRKHSTLETVFKTGKLKKTKRNDPLNSNILQAQLFELDNNDTYILIAYTFSESIGYGMVLYKYDQNSHTWDFHREFHKFSVSSFDVISSDEPYSGIHLVVTNSEHQGIHYYQWNFEYNRFIIKATYPKLESTTAMWVGIDANIFLLLSKEKTLIQKEQNSAYVYTEPIEVHILEENGFKLNYTVNIKGISSFEKFYFEGEMYVLAVSSHLQVIYVLQHRGFNGFEVIQKMGAPGIVSATVFTSRNFDLLLAISSSTGHTRILKCVARGNVYLQFENHYLP